MFELFPPVGELKFRICMLFGGEESPHPAAEIPHGTSSRSSL